MSNIPSDEEFARAKRLMREESRGLDKVSEVVKRHFGQTRPIYNVYILPQRDVDFRVYVLFSYDKDIEMCKRNGVLGEIEEFVYKELEVAGRCKRPDIVVAFEWDSHENVLANYDGDYFLRLR